MYIPFNSYPIYSIVATRAEATIHVLLHIVNSGGVNTVLASKASEIGPDASPLLCKCLMSPAHKTTHTTHTGLRTLRLPDFNAHSHPSYSIVATRTEASYIPVDTCPHYAHFYGCKRLLFVQKTKTVALLGRKFNCVKNLCTVTRFVA